MGKIFKKLTAGLKPAGIQTMKQGMGHRLFFCFILGIITGTVLINFIGVAYADKIGIYSEYVMGTVSGNESEVFSSWSFFIYCIKKYAVEIIIILVVSCTSLGKTFAGLYCVYKGMAIAILVSSATVVYGAGGLLIYVMSIFPHYFMYVPMLAFALFLGMKIRENLKNNNLVKVILKGAVIECGLIVATAVLEAYCNYPFIQRVFN